LLGLRQQKVASGVDADVVELGRLLTKWPLVNRRPLSEAHLSPPGIVLGSWS
jgi:hypothetical protein